MTPHLGPNTILETADEARARVFRMDKIGANFFKLILVI